MKQANGYISLSAQTMTKFIPSIFTSINLICGFVALVTGDHYIGSILLLDSLADLVSFGIAPAYLYFLLSPLDTWVGYIPPCILVASSALRLAIFNTKPSANDFSGLPTPATAIFMVGIFLAYAAANSEIINLLKNPIVYFSIPFFFSAMMLSKIRMFSFKKVTKGLRHNRVQIIFLLCIVVFAFVDVNLAFSLSVFNYIFLSILENRFSTVS